MRLCWSLFLIKLQASRLATLLKRDTNTGACAQHGVRNVSFSEKFAYGPATSLKRDINTGACAYQEGIRIDNFSENFAHLLNG